MDSEQRLIGILERERARLRSFIRRRVSNAADVEDILQDVFSELVEANRRLMPVDRVSAWLFRVARNRIIDFFRRRQPERFGDATIAAEDGELLRVEDLVPSREAGPESAFVRRRLIEELHRAMDELPAEQRTVFVAHEIDGTSFKQMAADTGININTLLARKRYAVLHLRARLQQAFDDLRKE